MTLLAVSSFSLHSQLGPLCIERRDEDGHLHDMTFDFPRLFTLEEFASAARDRVGVSAVELCQIQFDTFDPKRIDRLRQALDTAGVRLLTLPIDLGNFAQSNTDWRHDDERRAVEWFDIAAKLGARFVRVNAGAPGTTLTGDYRADLVDSLRRLAEAAHERGLELLIENHGGTSSDPDFIISLLEDVGSNRLGLLLDLGNFEPLVSLSQSRFTGASLDETVPDLEPIYQRIAKLAPHAKLVHAKSIDPAADGQPLPDLDRALSIVAKSGFKGPFSIEWEGREGDPWEKTAEVASTVRATFPELS